MSAPADALAGLTRRAQARQRRLRGRTRVVVQVGHCSQAVGALDVASALRAALPRGAHLTTAGCDGACFDAPTVLVTGPSGETVRLTRVAAASAADLVSKAAAGEFAPDPGPAPFFAPQRRLATYMLGAMDGTDAREYILHGGYAGLGRALSIGPERTIAEVEAADLRGRGGAYFPAAVKWKSVRQEAGTPRYLVVNAEEGEPCVFKDRHLMEGAAHRIVEGLVIAAYAADVHEAYVYINAEAELSAERMERAIEQARKLGLLGGDILGSGFGVDVEVRRGAGGYVCGEETALLNTMEGYRREPRLRPPFPTQAGLWSRPTVVNNPETLCSVPFILAHGAAAYREVGTGTDKGTKLISLSGAVQRSGVAEVPMGTSLHRIVHGVGGGPPAGHALWAVAVGGPSSGLLPVSLLDIAMKPGSLHESGVMLGAGGVVALDERTGPLEAVRLLAAYNAGESCGKCTPCREGTPRMVAVLDRLSGGRETADDVEELRYLVRVVADASLCGLGQAAGGPITSGLRFFEGKMAGQVR